MDCIYERWKWSFGGGNEFPDWLDSRAAALNL